MKVGFRKPSVKKSIKARTTGKLKRQVKKSVNPLYGKKGMGFAKDPERSVKNKIYHKTTFGVSDIVRMTAGGSGRQTQNNSGYSYGYKDKRFSKLLLLLYILIVIIGLAFHSSLWVIYIIIGAAGILIYFLLRRKMKYRIAGEPGPESDDPEFMISVKCPFCGALFDADRRSETVVCEYCDSKMKTPESILKKEEELELPEKNTNTGMGSLKRQIIILSLLFIITGLIGCAVTGSSEDDNTRTAVAEEEIEQESVVEETEPDVEVNEPEEEITPEATPEITPEPETTPEPDSAEEEPGFDPSMIPAYAGEPYEYVNDGVPFFGEDFTVEGEVYSDLDDLGRAGVAVAMLGKETMPEGERGDISSVHPTGWNDVKFEEIDGQNLFNRCHLIGWQLSGEDANEKNLITGTRYFNAQGMEPFESKTANYINETGNHVYYRVTPVYTRENLIADGVLMEAQSVEDDGLSFCIFCYNVQPDVIIDYATGEAASNVLHEVSAVPDRSVPIGSSSDEVAENTGASVQPIVVPVEDNEVREEDEKEEAVSEEVTYIGNANTRKFHKPGCSSVNDMKEKNKVFFHGDRQEVIDAGYVPCKRCNP